MMSISDLEFLEKFNHSHCFVGGHDDCPARQSIFEFAFEYGDFAGDDQIAVLYLAINVLFLKEARQGAG